MKGTMVQKEEAQVQTAIRLPAEMLERVDKIAERMSQQGLRVRRAEVIRLTIHKGISVLEAEASPQPQAAPKKKR